MPTISVVSRYSSPQDGCGQAMVITCTTSLIENLFASPSISWIGPNGHELPDMETNSSMLTNQFEKQLLFNGITPGNKGVYKCRVSISIPKAFVENHVQESSVIANTLCEFDI